MKVCTITCHNALNHGARLQACALLYYLKNSGHNAEVVDYRPEYMSFREKMWYWPGVSVKMWAKLFLQLHLRFDAVRRYAAFERFSEKYIPRTRQIYNTLSELQKNPPLADVYIAGSDQIWNTLFHNGKDAAYYLDFGVPKTKRISYAASFALPSLISDCESFVKEHLSVFDKISVRESSGVDILSALGYDAQVVVDPVFLLSANEWDILLNCCHDNKEEYILVYDVMGCDTIKCIAKRLAKKYGCKVYSISSRRYGYVDKNFSQAAPDKFVELIRNARCVVSNSFHGTVFAVIYHRDFFVVDRKDGLNERMHSLLMQFGLESRCVTENVLDKVLSAKISYKTIDSIMHRKISLSKEFLAKALKQ